MIVEVDCEDCDGQGRVEGMLCLACDGKGKYAQLDEDDAQPVPMADESTPHDPRPLVLQLLRPAADTEETRSVVCMVCGKTIAIPAFMYNIVRRHNRAELDAADASANQPYPYVPQYISDRQIAVCTDAAPGEVSPCVTAMRAQISRESQAALREMDRHFEDLRAGNLSSEGAAFLRRAGYHEDVKTYFEKQARAAAAPKEEPKEPKSKRSRKKKEPPTMATILKLVPEEGAKTDG